MRFHLHPTTTRDNFDDIEGTLYQRVTDLANVFATDDELGTADTEPGLTREAIYLLTAAVMQLTLALGAKEN